MVLVHGTIHAASPAHFSTSWQFACWRGAAFANCSHPWNTLRSAASTVTNNHTAAQLKQLNSSKSSNVCRAYTLAAPMLQSFTMLETQHSSSKPVVRLLSHPGVATTDQSTVGGEPSTEQRSSTDRCRPSEFAELHLCCDCRSVHSWRRAQC